MTNQAPKLRIGGIESFSIVNYPGKVSVVVFLQGCPWRCPFCYNTTLQAPTSEFEVSEETLFALLQKRKGIFDAVVFSGGEPLMQYTDSLKKVILRAKELGYLIGFHTGGYRSQAFKEILPLLDWVGFDIKSPFNEKKYKLAIGGINHLKQVEESFNLLLESGVNFECRTTCDPRVVSIEDIYNIADFLKLKGVKNYHLQKYRQIAGDSTPDSECEKFFKDDVLESYLLSKFANVEFRT